MKACGIAMRWALVIAQSAFIFYVSSLQEVAQIKPTIPQEDKFGHITVFLIWAFLFSGAMRATWPGLRIVPGIVLAVLGGLLYGATDEYHQTFVPLREASIADWIADGVGSLLGALIHAAWHYRKLRRSSPRAPGPEDSLER